MGQYGRLASVSASNSVLVTLGTDFRFENRSEWFSQYYNYNALIDYINHNNDLYHASITFATLSEYAQQVQKPTEKFKGDFFVYSDLGPDGTCRPDYWSGYFTTRPYWKLLGRRTEVAVRAAEVMYSLCWGRRRRSWTDEVLQCLRSQYVSLIQARRCLALFQHHDAITGTSPARVMADFEKKLLQANLYAGRIQNSCASLLSSNFTDSTCLNLLSMRPFHQYPRQVVLFNPLIKTRVDVVTLPVDRPVTVYDVRNDKPLLSQINSYDSYFEVVFIVEVPPLSFSAYLLTPSPTSTVSRYSEIAPMVNFSVETDLQSLLFDQDTGTPLGFLMDQEKVIKLRVSVKAYSSVPSRSGAYLFLPQENSAEGKELKSKTIEILEGSLYKEVSSQFGGNFIIKTRLYNHNSVLGDVVEIITVTDLGRNPSTTNFELYLRFETDIENGKFWTDTNGLGMRERVLVNELRVSGNYYPMTERAYLEDGSSRLSLCSDHSHGVASLQSGQLEVMIDRRISRDDLRGMGEGLQDRKMCMSRFYVFLASPAKAEEVTPQLLQELNQPCPQFEASLGYTPRFAPFVNNPLPPNTQLINLRTLSLDDVSPSAATLMILHRFTNSSDKPFYPNTYFSGITPQTIVKCFLNGIDRTESYATLDEVEIEPNSILVLKLYM